MSEDRKKIAPSRASEVIAHVEERRVETDAVLDAATVRADGMRVDRILEVALKAMADACRLHQQMADALLSHQKAHADESVAMIRAQAELLSAVRVHFLERVQAEGDAAVAAQQASNGDMEPLVAALAQRMIAEGKLGG